MQFFPTHQVFLKIGNFEINGYAALAPMAGVCNSAFRRIIKEMGCGLLYAEMVSDKALCFDNEKTMDMLYMLWVTSMKKVNIYKTQKFV